MPSQTEGKGLASSHVTIREMKSPSRDVRQLCHMSRLDKVSAGSDQKSLAGTHFDWFAKKKKKQVDGLTAREWP